MTAVCKNHNIDLWVFRNRDICHAVNPIRKK